jgi:hypothetical protein
VIHDICQLASPLKSGEFQGFFLATEAVAHTGKVVQLTRVTGNSSAIRLGSDAKQPGGFLMEKRHAILLANNCGDPGNLGSGKVVVLWSVTMISCLFWRRLSCRSAPGAD